MVPDLYPSGSCTLMTGYHNDYVGHILVLAHVPVSFSGYPPQGFFGSIYTLVHKYYMLSLEQVVEILLQLTLPVKMSMSLSQVESCTLSGKASSFQSQTIHHARHIPYCHWHTEPR